MQLQRTLLVTMIALVITLLAACTAPAPSATGEGQAAASGPQQGGTLTMSLGDDFTTFHPFFDVNSRYFKPIFFEPPIRISEAGDFEPWLAESWEIGADGKSVTLKLRQGVKFHNGREMTADDLVWSVDLARDQEIGHHLGDRFTTCTGAVKIDEQTVRIEYSEETASILDGLARLYIFPQEALETIDTVPVGTGPFQFTEWIPGDSTTAERFDDYWRAGEPLLDKIVIKPLPDAQSRIINLQSGSIDLLMDAPLSEKAALEQEAGMVVGQVAPGFGFWAFIMNVNAPPFDNVKVRQAMQYAIDRQKIIDTVFFGEATPVLIPYAPTSWAYPADLDDYYTYDPEKAKALLAEAGYPDGFSTQMLIRGASDAHLDQAQVYQQDLAAVGIDVELVPTELPQYWPQLFDSQFTIVSHATGDATVDPSGLFEGAACCRPFRNFFGITEDATWFPAYRDTILEARGLQDRGARAELYHQAVETLLEQAWTIPVSWRQEVYAYRDNVQGFRVDMDGLIWPGQMSVTE
ncbi:MAG: ABC transporter substrate-binding protein [Caldilineaceae bacterium]